MAKLYTITVLHAPVNKFIIARIPQILAEFLRSLQLKYLTGRYLFKILKNRDFAGVKKFINFNDKPECKKKPSPDVTQRGSPASYFATIICGDICSASTT